MPFVYFCVSLVGFCAALGIVYLVYYNKLQSKKIRVDESEVVIDDTLRKRYDLVIRICDIIKSSVKIKADYFKGFENLKNKNLSNFDLDRKITEAMTLILKVKEDYPELNDEKSLNEIFKELKENEEKLEAAKNFYNKYTGELNVLVKTFPSNIVSRIHRLDKKAYFDGKDLDDDIIKDFKL